MNYLQPFLNPGTYQFQTRLQVEFHPGIIATFREEEGITLIVRTDSNGDDALNEEDMLWSWITLQNNTSLDKVGITAKFAAALAKSDIPCNVMAAHHHDHIFVPIGKTQDAMDILGQVRI